MAIALTNLVPFLRISMNDTDAECYEYSDDELVNALTFGVQVQEGSWDQGYTISNASITPDPPTWLQMLYVLKTCIMLKTFAEKFSYDNGSVKVTSNSKKNDLEVLNSMYKEIIESRKDTDNCFAFDTWECYVTKWEKIYSEIGTYYYGNE